MFSDSNAKLSEAYLLEDLAGVHVVGDGLEAAGRPPHDAADVLDHAANR